MKKNLCRKFSFGLLFLSLILTFNLSLFFIDKSTFEAEKGFVKYNHSDKVNELRLSSSKPNGRPLLVHQCANITKIHTDISSGENVSFSLVQDWTSENITLDYKGVSIKNQWTTNGDLLNNASGWTYEEIDTNGRFDNYGGAFYADYAGNPVGSVRFEATSGDYYEQDSAYFYQNISIPHELSPKSATISMDFNYNGVNKIPNGSMYIGVVINGIEANKTIHMNDITTSQWTTLQLQYNPVSFGQSLPGEVTVKYGVYVHGDCTRGSGGPVTIFLDNLKFELWSEPNQSELIRVYDNEFSQNYSYQNTTYGEGYSFIDVERTRSPTNLVVFTIYQNISDVIDLNIDTLTITSFAEKIMNTTIDGQVGSQYYNGDSINWDIEFSIFIPTDYFGWLIIDKPKDFFFSSIEDGFNVEQIGNCVGTGLGSTQLIIPHSILQAGIWKCEAISENYILTGHTAVWKGGLYENCSSMTYGDKFLVNITLNNSISLTNTLINLTICYPNGSVYYNLSRESTSYTELFGFFTVGKNMSVGEYTAITEWTNNFSSNNRDKVGYSEIIFKVWHHTNLTAVETYIEKISGDPCLIKVNYTDYDFDIYIAFATITYNSTFGQSGSMIYLGSGTYFLDLDSSGLELGDYYFSFNASKIYYQNQTSINLIHLRIKPQPLAIQVPGSIISGVANDYVSCQINVTGAFSGTLIWPANISTDWQNPYSTINHNNGTFTLNFSTWNLPTQGIIETYTVSIHANKTNYGTASTFLTISIHPIQIILNANATYIPVTINQMVDLRINTTHAESGMLIDGINYSVQWPGIFNIITDSSNIILQLNTTNLSIDTYTAIIKAEKPGYSTVFKTITVVVDYLEFKVNPVNFQDTIETLIGETRVIIINLTDPYTDVNIDNASIFYDWEFGVGYFKFLGDGVYELEIKIPPNIEGNFKMTLTASKEDSIYKRTEFSFIIVINLPTQSNNIPWYILITLLSIIGILGAVSLRTYVYKPIKIKKRNELLANTQRYKDIMNIEMILVSNRESGIHIYSKSYDILKDTKNELLSGFIQAITLISDEIVGKEKLEQIMIKSDKIKGKEQIIELDFKHFNFFISDYKEYRIVFILKDKASERFKNKTAEFLSDLYQFTIDKFQKWDGNLALFNKIIPSLLEKHFYIYYREKFKINPVVNVSRLVKEADFNKIATRLLNVILSMTRLHPEFYLEDTIKPIQGKNKDRVIEGLEKIIENQIIIPANR